MVTRTTNHPRSSSQFFHTDFLVQCCVFTRAHAPGLACCVHTECARSHVACVCILCTRRSATPRGGALRELTRHICTHASYITTRRLCEIRTYCSHKAFSIVVIGLRASNTLFLFICGTGMCGPPMNLCRTKPHVRSMCRACFDSCAFKILSC